VADDHQKKRKKKRKKKGTIKINGPISQYILVEKFASPNLE